MTDLELNRTLALAIVWKLVTYAGNRCFVFDYVVGWKEFDHADWRVAGPIAEKFDCFPWSDGCKHWCSEVDCWTHTTADTPQKAIALAAIQGAGK